MFNTWANYPQITVPTGTKDAQNPADESSPSPVKARWFN
jgi:hypothetical protein